MVDESLKPRYAAFLLEEPEPFKAGLRLFPDSTGDALWCAINWANDPEVLAELNRLSEEQGESALPDKKDLLREVWRWVSADPQTAKLDDRLKAARLYAEMRDYLPKQGATGVNVQVNVPNVMVVNDHGTDSDWEKALEQQQQALLSENNAPTKH